MPADTTYVATLTPVWTGVHVSLALTQDTAGWDAVAANTTGGTLEVLINGSYQYALDFKHPKLSTGENADRLDAVAIGLFPNTAYTFRIQFKRTKTSDGTEMENGGAGIAATTETSTTLDDSPPYATTGTKYFLTPTGTDGAAGTSYTAPKRYIGTLAALIAPGDEILFSEDVNYATGSPSNSYRWTATAGLEGDSTHWVRITGYDSSTGNYGRGEIQGFISTGEPAGAWVSHTGEIWKKTGFLAGERAAIVYDIALGKQLPTCFRYLTDAGAQSFEFEDYATDVPGFCFVWNATASSQTLYVRTYTGGQPSDGQFRIACKLGLILVNADYIIIENMDFTLCATVDAANPTVDSGVYGLRLDTCTNVIIRNCKFDHAPLFINGCTKVLIENCYFNGSGVWDQWMAESVNDPYSTSGLMGWTAVKNQVLDRIAMDIEDSFQVEVRNCHTTETANFATINGPSNTCGFVYIHDCRGSKLFDEFIECDTTIIYPLVVANCRVQDTHNFTSFTPGTEGIAWILNCEVFDPLLAAFKTGGTTYDLSQMRVEYVNCTEYNSRYRALGEGASEGSFHVGIGGEVANIHWTNCVIVVASDVYVFYSSAGNSTSPCTLDTCCVHNLGTSVTWRYNATEYTAGTTTQNAASFDTAQASWTFTSLDTSGNPMPGGMLAGVKSSLRTGAKAYHGVTNMAVDGGGRREPSSPRFGAFGGALAYSGRDQEQLRDRLIRMSIAWLALFLLPAIASAGGKSDHGQYDRARLGHVDGREVFPILVVVPASGVGRCDVPESLGLRPEAIEWNCGRKDRAVEAIRKPVGLDLDTSANVGQRHIDHATISKINGKYACPINDTAGAGFNVWNAESNPQIIDAGIAIEPHAEIDFIRLGQVDGVVALDDKRLIGATSRSEQHSGGDSDSSHGTPLGLVGDGQ